MINRLFFILISNHLLLITTSLIIHTQRTKENEEICLKNHFRSFSTNNLRVCYMNNNRDRSIHIWFTIDKSLQTIFHFYRFILRSIDDVSLSTTNIYMLTNFTELIDLNNSLRILNLNSGQYEICIDFQMNSTSFIYSPRYGCIPIRIGELLHGSFKQSSTQLLIALTTGIILFLIICHIVQSLKKKQQEDVPEVRSRSSSILSTTSLRKQRDRIVRKLFRRHVDQPSASQMQQWARNRAFRHRISTSEQEIQHGIPISQWDIQSLPSSNDIYTIPMNNSSRKTSFEEFEIL